MEEAVKEPPSAAVPQRSRKSRQKNRSQKKREEPRFSVSMSSREFLFSLRTNWAIAVRRAQSQSIGTRSGKSHHSVNPKPVAGGDCSLRLSRL